MIVKVMFIVKVNQTDCPVTKYFYFIRHKWVKRTQFFFLFLCHN